MAELAVDRMTDQMLWRNLMVALITLNSAQQGQLSWRQRKQLYSESYRIACELRVRGQQLQLEASLGLRS